ncbi:Aminocarboxymuconate-semialdehyde decarboxylase [Cupriavidus taiwanensis]|uniref:Aminocarboxymuconate-semialdehyde decarboxylase n=1 Tax=Cupriavidus taiwanensis TaxID=164546 RepID=A0A976A6T5_9BURK|nr:amidohydrolase family protein [Cupriavidus taiwanensis]SOY64337.1 Aminocarboxymuconate-semialdehyde decarboxylase [Cupriavidus taiwanensis]
MYQHDGARVAPTGGSLPAAHGQCGCIDVHTHVVPHDFPRYVGSRADAPWPSMVAAQACHRHVMVSGKVYRTVSDHAWDTWRRIDDMDAADIAQQVLSPMPELLAYWLDGEDGAAMARYLNDTIASMVTSAPHRFVGLGAVPLQDVDRAVAELDHAVHQLGLAGVEIGGNVNGVPIGDARFRPFFEAAEQWGAALFVHPLRPAGLDRLVGPAALEQVLAFPGEIGLAAASMITGGTLARYPRLRIAFSHGGGSLPVLLARLQHAWDAFRPLRDMIGLAPRELARSMYYDDLLYDTTAIVSLIGLMGPAQVMVGSDYPFAIMDKDPVGRVATLNVRDEWIPLLRGGNARRWLGLESAEP